MVAGQEDDSFDASSHDLLDMLLDPMLIYLPSTDAHVEYTGVTTRWGLVGLGRRNYVTLLAGREEAYAFLNDGRGRQSGSARPRWRTIEAESWRRRARRMPRANAKRDGIAAEVLAG